ncbi:MAG: hypothetical protein HY290_26570 [Planctomycetia bacterium]|nr:hypothetical protein [Planctomycetia bacterium]
MRNSVTASVRAIILLPPSTGGLRGGRQSTPPWTPFVVLLALLGIQATGRADDKPSPDESAKKRPAAPAIENGAVPLNKNGTVLLDKKKNRVLLKTHVVLQRGALEMLICKKQTKEHESILAIDAQAYVIHTGLLALGAKPGKPYHFDKEYFPPTGQKIDIFLNWTDDAGKSHRVPAQSWVRQAINRYWSVKMESLPVGLTLPKNSELRYDRKLKELSWYGPMTEAQRDEFLGLSKDKAYRQAVESFFEQSQSREMKADWVFAGSGFYVDEVSGNKQYNAEDGDLICVANFEGAMLDVSIASSASNDERNFEAYTDRIPPKETPVTVELIPVPEPKEKPGPKEQKDNKKKS